MSFAGTVIDAIKRNSANRSMQINRRNTIKERLNSLTNKSQFSKKEIIFKPNVYTKLQLKELRTNIKKDQRLSLLKSSFISLVLVGVIIYSCIYLFGLIKPFI